MLRAADKTEYWTLLTCLRGLLTGIVILSLQTNAAAAKDGGDSDNMFGVISGYFGSSKPTNDDKACDRVFYSSTCNRWMQAYAKNDTAAAQSAWNQMLTDLRGCQSIDHLLDKLNTQVNFAIPEDAPEGSRLTKIPLYRNFVAFTEKSVGPDHRFVLNALFPLADALEQHKEYKAAFDCRTRIVLIMEKIQPPRPCDLSKELGYSCFDLCRVKQFKEAEPLVQRAIAIAEAQHCTNDLPSYVRLYGQLLAATNRKAERDQLFAKYGSTLQQTK